MVLRVVDDLVHIGPCYQGVGGRNEDVLDEKLEFLLKSVFEEAFLA